MAGDKLLGQDQRVNHGNLLSPLLFLALLYFDTRCRGNILLTD
jgi:hypothetical protein